MKQTDAVQLAFKREADPKGLLNPGKMIAWENPDFDFDDRTRSICSPACRRAELTAMRVLVLFAHPVETSFQAALHQRRRRER